MSSTEWDPQYVEALAAEVDKIHDVSWDAEAKAVAIFEAAVSKGAFSGPAFVTLHAKLQRLKMASDSPPDFEDYSPKNVLSMVAAAIVLQRKKHLPDCFHPLSGYSQPYYFLRILAAGLRLEARKMRSSQSVAPLGPPRIDAPAGGGRESSPARQK